MNQYEQLVFMGHGAILAMSMVQFWLMEAVTASNDLGGQPWPRQCVCDDQNDLPTKFQFSIVLSWLSFGGLCGEEDETDSL